MILILFAVLVLLMGKAWGSETDEMATLPVPYEEQDDFIRDKIREHIGNYPLLEKIAGCESTGDPDHIRHWRKDGSLIKNPHSSASGALQVLLGYHSEWIKREGRNMYDIDEYMKFVDTLFRHQGYDAWYPSKHCWGKYQHHTQS